MDRLTSAMSFDDSNKTDASTPLELKNDTTERGKAVLIIDDSISIRKGLVRGFSRLGFDVDEAENGMQGLKLLKNRLYDLVLLDFLMPVMDGPDMARMFREWENNNRPNFHQYIVGISAHANGKDAEVGIKAGMDQFIGKPISLKALNDLAQSKAVIQATMLLDLKHKKSLEDLNTALHMAENKSKSQLEDKSLSESSASSKTASTVEKQCCLIVAKVCNITRMKRQLLITFILISSLLSLVFFGPKGE
jgi:CheY-like chemotaxis protein